MKLHAGHKKFALTSSPSVALSNPTKDFRARGLAVISHCIDFVNSLNYDNTLSRNNMVTVTGIRVLTGRNPPKRNALKTTCADHAYRRPHVSFSEQQTKTREMMAQAAHKSY